jgi:hypothetical protein
MIRSIPAYGLTLSLTLIPLPSFAQATFPPSSFKNLQVLPKDATAGDVVGTMKTFAGSLGVRCQFCHVGQEGMPLEQFDFVSDELAQKKTARVMMRLVQDINKQIDAALPPSAPGARVTCFTCHRGAQKPLSVRP